MANNSVVILKPSSCRYCKVAFYCYSNSSDTNNGYIIFPNGRRYYNSRSYSVHIQREIPSGIQFQNHVYNAPYYQGVYTCQLPDSNGNILNIYIAYYTTEPSMYIVCILYKMYKFFIIFIFPCCIHISGQPNIYYSRYIDLSNDGQKSTSFGKIEIKTEYSPPTNVTWQRDGVTVYIHPHLERAGYEMVQIVTNRISSHYTTYLLIRNATHLVGSHTYTCIVQNKIGIASRNVSTHMKGKVYINSVFFEATFHS